MGEVLKPNKVLEAFIIQTVKRAYMEVNESYNEEYLTAEDLCKAIPLFRPEWVRKNWKKLPCESLGWQDKDGVWHDCQRCYPKKKILRMISEGKFRRMKNTPSQD